MYVYIRLEVAAREKDHYDHSLVDVPFERADVLKGLGLGLTRHIYIYIRLEVAAREKDHCDHGFFDVSFERADALYTFGGGG